jgi:hypothetical protein
MKVWLLLCVCVCVREKYCTNMCNYFAWSSGDIIGHYRVYAGEAVKVRSTQEPEILKSSVLKP